MSVILNNVLEVGKSYKLTQHPNKKHIKYHELKDMVGQLFTYKGNTTSARRAEFEHLGDTYYLNPVLFLDSDRFYNDPGSSKVTTTAIMVVRNCKISQFNDKYKKREVKTGTIFDNVEANGEQHLLVTTNNGTKYTIAKHIVMPIFDIESEKKSENISTDIEPLSPEVVNQALLNIVETPTIEPKGYEINDKVFQDRECEEKSYDLSIKTVTTYEVNGLTFNTLSEAKAAQRAFKTLLD